MPKEQTKTFQAVFEKIEECKFFIDLMEHYRIEPKNFGFCLSAYLSAFKSILDRLIYMPGRRSPEKEIGKVVASLKRASPEVNFLAKARNVEVHQKGIAIHFARPRKSSPRKPLSQRLGARHSRFDDPIWTSPSGRTRKSWFFRDMPKHELVTLCRNGLKQLRQLVCELADAENCGNQG